MLTMLALAAAFNTADASSHREAPGTALDPAADITDVYAFVNPNNPDKTVLIMNVVPLLEPGGGPNYGLFDRHVQYEIHVDNEGDAHEDITFRFNFSTDINAPGEFLYNFGDVSDPANLNLVQWYQATRWDDGQRTNLGYGYVAPANVGLASVGAGGYNAMGDTPGTITQAHIFSDGNMRTFAGPRQEGFFVDLENTFDLLNLAGGNGANVNTLLGKNVMSMAIEVDTTSLTRDGQAPTADGGNDVVSIWGTTSRPRLRMLDGPGGERRGGGMVQVARLGNPLVNEVGIGLGDKDAFNRSHPSDDTQWLSYVTNPTLPVYIEAVLGVTNPVSYDAGLGIGGREDLVLALLTGHPDLGTLPKDYELGGAIPGEAGKVFGACDALRMNLGTASGWPNGRFVSDDVVDTALSAMVGLLIDGSTLSDGVGPEGLHYLGEFPFLGDPWSGNDHPSAHHGPQ